MSFVSAVGLVFRTAVTHWRTNLTIASLYAVLAGLANVVTRSSTGIVDPTTLQPSDVASAGIQAVVAIGLVLLVNVFAGPVTVGALSLVGSAAVYGDEVDTRGIVRRALDRALDAVGATVLLALIIGLPVAVLGSVSLGLLVASRSLGFAFLMFGSVVLGLILLYVCVRSSLAIVVVMREGRGPLAALRRSWEIVGGAWWWVFGVAVVIALCVGVFVSIVSIRSFSGPDSGVDFVVGALANAVAAVVATVSFGIATGVVYAIRVPGDPAVVPLQGFAVDAPAEVGTEQAPSE